MVQVTIDPSDISSLSPRPLIKTPFLRFNQTSPAFTMPADYTNGSQSSQASSANGQVLILHTRVTEEWTVIRSPPRRLAASTPSTASSRVSGASTVRPPPRLLMPAPPPSDRIQGSSSHRPSTSRLLSSPGGGSHVSGSRAAPRAPPSRAPSRLTASALSRVSGASAASTSRGPAGSVVPTLGPNDSVSQYSRGSRSHRGHSGQ